VDFEWIFRGDLRRPHDGEDAADVEYWAMGVGIFLGRHGIYMNSMMKGRAQRYGAWKYG
jgi:hypothetical protein